MKVVIQRETNENQGTLSRMTGGMSEEDEYDEEERKRQRCV